jgi:hypothetical protein
MLGIADPEPDQQAQQLIALPGLEIGARSISRLRARTANGSDMT